MINFLEEIGRKVNWLRFGDFFGADDKTPKRPPRPAVRRSSADYQPRNYITILLL
jgi:hypothetical protein